MIDHIAPSNDWDCQVHRNSDGFNRVIHGQTLALKTLPEAPIEPTGNLIAALKSQKKKILDAQGECVESRTLGQKPGQEGSPRLTGKIP